MSSSLSEIPHFDSSAIETLKSVAGDEGPAFVSEMAQLFLAETREALARLKQASTLGDWKQVNRIAHAQKSSSATLGLMRLSASCRALELETMTSSSGPRTMALVAAVLEDFEQASPSLQRLV